MAEALAMRVEAMNLTRSDPSAQAAWAVFWLRRVADVLDVLGGAVVVALVTSTFRDSVPAAGLRASGAELARRERAELRAGEPTLGRVRGALDVAARTVELDGVGLLERGSRHGRLHSHGVHLGTEAAICGRVDWWRDRYGACRADVLDATEDAAAVAAYCHKALEYVGKSYDGVTLALGESLPWFTERSGAIEWADGGGVTVQDWQIADSRRAQREAERGERWIEDGGDLRAVLDGCADGPAVVRRAAALARARGLV